MRVTLNSVNDSLIARLQALGKRQAELQAEASTGQKLQRADSDPAAASRALRLQESARQSEQYQVNIARHKDRAAAGMSAISSLKKTLDRAQELAVLAGGAASPEDLKSYAVEVRSLLDRAVQIANTRHNDEFLFAGARGSAAPFQAAKDASGRIESVAFTGSAELPQSEIASGALVSSHVAGANSSGAGERGLFADSRFGADLFGHLSALARSLESADRAGIATQAAALQRDEDNILHHVAANAAFQGRLEASAKLADSAALQARAGISEVADADLAQTLLQLNQNQTAYQAALQSAARTFDLSLLNFIR